MPKQKERFLLLRYGGMGDNMFMTPVAKALHDRGYIVDVATRKSAAPLMENNPYIDKVLISERFGPQDAYPDGKPISLILVDNVWIPERFIYRDYMTKKPRTWKPYNVANYFGIIEGCTIHPELSKTQISNYMNTYDAHLSWAGIDPESIPDADKNPVYFVSTEEREWAEKVVGQLDKKPVMLQTFASSPARSYSPTSLINFIVEKKDHLIAWDPARNQWVLDGLDIEWPEGIPTIRATAALIEQCKFVVAADTCVTHLTEAIGVAHMSFYTVTPAWTRSKYYQHEVTIDSKAKFEGQKCKCCQITRDCPRKAVEAMSKITIEETELLAMVPATHQLRRHMVLPNPAQPDCPGGDVLKHFKVTSPQAVNQKIDAAVRRYDTILQETAYCLDSIDLFKMLKRNYKKLCEMGSDNE